MKTRTASDVGQYHTLKPGVLGYARISVTILSLALVGIPFVSVLTRFVSGDRSQATLLLFPGLGLLVSLGLVTILSIFVVRRLHLILSIMFFGSITELMIVNVISELLGEASYGSVEQTVVQYGLMFATGLVSLSGIIIEEILRLPK